MGLLASGRGRVGGLIILQRTGLSVFSSEFVDIPLTVVFFSVFFYISQDSRLSFCDGCNRVTFPISRSPSCPPATVVMHKR